MKKESGKRRINSLFNGSIIFSSLDRLAALIYRKAGEGFFGRVMSSFESENRSLRESRIARADATHKKKQIKKTIARGCEQSRLLGAVTDLLNMLSRCRLRCYGIFSLVFGALYTAVLLYRRLPLREGLSSYAVCAALVLCGLLLLLSRDTLAVGISKTRLLDFLLFDVLGVRHGAIDTDGQPCGHIPAAIFTGLIFGALSFFVPAGYILLACVGLLALYTVLIIPEIGVVAVLFSLPFLPTLLLVAMVLYTFVCYLLKLWRGKRTFRMNLLDASVGVFLIFMAAGGIFSVGGSGSIYPALVYICFMLSYFLFVNLIRSDAWIKRCIIAAAISCALVALYGVYQNFFGAADTTWQDTDMFTDIRGRVVSTFENPNVLGEYLIMVIPFIVAIMISAEKKWAKFGYFMMLCSCCACLVFTWSRGAWLGIILAMLIFLLVYSRKTLVLCLCGLFALPFAPLVLPSSIMNRITSIGDVTDSSTSYRVNIWKASVKLLHDYAFTGIGVGNAAFKKIYPKYSLPGVESAPHAHNLFLQTGIETGIPGLIVLLLIFFILAQSCITFFMKSDAGRAHKLTVAALFAGIIGVMLQGMTDYIWYNYRVYLMFWCMVGLCAAVQRVANEKDSVNPPSADI